jgi:hypothetical protein
VVIAPRYAPAVCLVAALALVPTLIHSYAGLVVDDGLTAQAIPESLAGFTSAPSGRNAEWGRRRFESHDWIERRYVSGADEVVLTVVRSYDLKALYHHPELAVAYGTSFVESRVESFDVRPAIPVHVLSTGREEGPVGLYVLHSGGAFVDDPIRFQIRTAGELLFRGRRAMTLFFARDSSVARGSALEGRRSLALLFEAIDAFTRAKRQKH